MNPQIWAEEFSSSEELNFSFDWHDSHSDWRFEELLPLLQECNLILKKYNKPTIEAESISDLIDLDKGYRNLLHDQDFSSDDIVKFLRNMDSLSLSYDTLSMDSSFEFDSLIERINELLEIWQDGDSICYSEDEWEINPLSYFENLQRSRNGLGDRWSIKFREESILMPDGKEIFRFDRSGLRGEVFNTITDNDYSYYCDNLDYVAQALDLMSESELATLKAIGEEFNSHSDSQFPTKEFIKSFQDETKKIKSLTETLEHISAFLPTWEGTDLELLRASSTI